VKISRSSIQGFHDQVCEDSDLFFQTNETSYLEYFTPKFSIYYVELELHDRNRISRPSIRGLLSFFSKQRDKLP
jgi:hypothetical protein